MVNVISVEGEDAEKDIVEIEISDIHGRAYIAKCRQEHLAYFQSVKFYEHNQDGKRYWKEVETEKKLGEFVAQGTRKDGLVLISANQAPGVFLSEFWFFGTKSQSQLYAHPRSKIIKIDGKEYEVPRGISWIAGKNGWQIKCCGEYIGLVKEPKNLYKAVAILRKEHIRRFGKSPIDMVDVFTRDFFCSPSELPYQGIIHRIDPTKTGGIKITFKSNDGKYATLTIQSTVLGSSRFSKTLSRAADFHEQNLPIEFVVVANKNPKHSPYVSNFRTLAEKIVDGYNLDFEDDLED